MPLHNRWCVSSGKVHTSVIYIAYQYCPCRNSRVLHAHTIYTEFISPYVQLCVAVQGQTVLLNSRHTSSTRPPKLPRSGVLLFYKLNRSQTVPGERACADPRGWLHATHPPGTLGLAGYMQLQGLQVTPGPHHLGAWACQRSNPLRFQANRPCQRPYSWLPACQYRALTRNYPHLQGRHNTKSCSLQSVARSIRFVP